MAMEHLPLSKISSIPPYLSSQLSLPIHRLPLTHSPPLLPLRNRRLFLLSATPAPLDSDLNKQRKESNEAWEHAWSSFKEQAMRLQSVSKQAYLTYSNKALIAFKDKSKKLKIEAAKASYDLSIIAREIGEEGTLYIAKSAADSPEPVKDVLKTFACSTKHVQNVSQLRDFYIGVPYGAILSVAGFFNFMVTGSTSAVRFGVILGCAMLALSVSSLRLWRKEKLADGVILKCEAAIAGILFLRHFWQKVSFFGLLNTCNSGAVAAFFIYRLMMMGQDVNKSIDIDGLIN